MAKPEPLGVWLYGLRVAQLTTSGPGKLAYRYTDEAIETWPGNAPILSCSLLLGTRRLDAGVYFRGLLPEGQHLHAMAAAAGVTTMDTFGLLARYGKDVAGAAVVATDYPGDRPGEVEPYTAEGLNEEVSALPGRPLAIHDDSELSLAGIQDKLLLIDLGRGNWGRPVHGRPSTHILKVEDRRFPGMAARESDCLRLARTAGLTTVDSHVEHIGGLPCLIVSRFDRRTVDGITERIHQEDACQALGVDAGLKDNKGKYEDAGGPSLQDIARLLDTYAVDAEAELVRLASAVTFTVLIGNADAHGKNLAFLHPSPGTISLAPLYDTVPTALWPKLRTRGAMMINRRVNLKDITMRDIVDEAGRWPLSPGLAEGAVVSTTKAVLGGLELDAMSADLADFVSARAERLLADTAA